MKTPERDRSGYSDEYKAVYGIYESPEETATKKPPLILRFLKAASFYIITALIFLMLNLFVVRLGLVNGDSMQPTLHDHDIVIIWQLLYSPEAGDIIVTNTDNELGISLTKRVIATGGQSVYIRDGQLYVDGQLREEDYLLDINWGGIATDITVPEGQVFLMGDNRNGSYDSRELGCFSAADLMGQVVIRIFPFTGIRTF